jgi:hypothetical protein
MNLRTSGLIAAAALTTFAIAVITWGSAATFDDNRLVCAGGPGPANPALHSECRGGPIPADSALTHHSPVGFVALSVTIVLLGWLLLAAMRAFRSRALREH